MPKRLPPSRCRCAYIGRFQEVLDTWPEQDLGDMLMIAARIAPDLPRKVVERLGWGPGELAMLNLTEIFA